MIFIIIFILSFLVLAWKKTDIAILVLFFLLPSYLIRFYVFGIPTTLLESMILTVFFVWLIKNIKSLTTKIKNNLKNKQIKLRYPWDIEIILLLIISLVAVATVGWTNSALGIWKAYFFEPILLFLVVANFFQTKKDFNKIILSLSFSALAVSLFGIFQHFTGLYIQNPFWSAEATRRITSFFEYPNAVALYLAPIIILIFGWLLDLLKHKQIKKISAMGIGLIIVFSLLAIYFAKSEGALAALLIVFFVIASLSNKKSTFIAFISAVILFFGFWTYLPLHNYMIKKITMNDLSGQIRKLQWKETFRMLDNHFWLGAGLTGYQQTIKPYHQKGFFYNFDNDPNFHEKTMISAEYRKTHWQPVEIYLYPHNIFLNFWTELGFVGMLLFVWLILKYFVLIQRMIETSKHKYFILGLGGSLLVMIIHGWVDVPYFKNDLSVLFWLLFLMVGFSFKQINDENKRV